MKLRSYEEERKRKRGGMQEYPVTFISPHVIGGAYLHVVYRVYNLDSHVVLIV